MYFEGGVEPGEERLGGLAVRSNTLHLKDNDDINQYLAINRLVYSSFINFRIPFIMFLASSKLANFDIIKNIQVGPYS